MSNAYELDLDTMLPEPHKVKLNGQVYEVQAPKLKTVFKIQKVVERMQAGDTNAFEDFRNALAEVVPVLNEENVDVTAQQLIALSEFVFKIAQPADTTLVKPTSGGGEKKDDENTETGS